MPDALPERYRPTAIVGRGGQGYVLHAVDTRHDRPVAIKVCNTGAELDRQTLLDEARVLLTLRPHPNLPLARDDFLVDDRYCIVMDWVDGSSLAQMLASSDEGLPVENVIDALEQVASALDHLHAHDPPLLHLDVKPSNILVRPDGRVVLVDLGLSSRSAPTSGGGTTDYLAPECGAGETPTRAADVFSLAVTAYELLTGQTPGPGAMPVFSGVRSDEEARRLSTALRRGMATDPARRPASAGELVAALRRPPARNNLPASLSSFVGREADLGDLRTVLGSQRSVTLVGVGGVGKTRLALELARGAVASFDAVWFVELAGLDAGSSVVDHVARTLGIREERDRERSVSLSDALGAGRQLLVLDTCEHVLGASADIAAELVRSCPELHVLATSREPLRIAGEVVRRVAAMRLPDDRTAPADSEAVRLFVERARATDPRALSDGPGAERIIADVCVALDGLPLAIELAAALVGELSLDELADQLDDQLGALVRGPRTMPRHETLRAAMQWSYGLLQTAEREVLAELSVFAGTFGAEAARAVTGREDVEVTIAALVDRSLCERRSRRSDEGLYLLAPVRAFAAEQLAANVTDVLRDRHLVWHRELAEQARTQLRRAEQAAWIDRLDDAYDDLRSAVGWAHASSADDELRLAVALAPFWIVRGDWSLGRGALEAALRGEPRSSLAARAWLELGSLARLQGDDGSARSSFERADELAEAHGDEVVSIAARGGLARLLSDRGDHADASAAVERLLTRARHIEAPDLVANLLGELGGSSQFLGDLTGAREAFTEAAAIARSLGDVRRVAGLEGCRGTVAFIEGDIATARRVFEQERALAQELRDEALIATATSHLASCASREGDHDAACALYAESLEIFRRLGHRWRVALTLSELAQSTLQSGDLEAGRVLLNESLELSVRYGFHLIQGESLHKLALLAHAQGDDAASARALADAIRICREHGDTLRIVLLVEHAAVLAAESGRPDDAIVLAAAAGAQRERIGFPRHRLPVLEAALAEAADAVGERGVRGAERRGHQTPMTDAVTSAVELCMELVDR